MKPFKFKITQNIYLICVYILLNLKFSSFAMTTNLKSIKVLFLKFFLCKTLQLHYYKNYFTIMYSFTFRFTFKSKVI